MKRVSVILLVLLALAAFAAAAEKPKEFGGGDRVAELGPWVYFGDDAGRSEMWWLPEIGWYEFYPADGGYAWSWLEYYYFDGVYYMWDVALAYAFPGFNFSCIYIPEEQRATAFVRYPDLGIWWILYDREPEEFNIETRGRAIPEDPQPVLVPGGE